MGMFNLGGIIGAFAGPKLSKVYNNDALQGQIDSSIGGMDQYRQTANDALAGYGRANTAAIGDVTRLNKQSEGETNSILGGLRNANFMGDRNSARDSDLGALNGLLGNIGGGMSASDKVAASRLGYAGRPSSTYMDKARQSYLGAFASPIASSIFNNATGAAYGAAGDRYNNANAQIGLMNYRNQLPAATAGMYLNPLYAAQQARQSEIGQLGGLSDVNRSNLAGFQSKQNKWAAAAGAVDESLNSAADTAMSLYSGGMVKNGGHGGGMGGPQSYQLPPQYQYGGYGSAAGYGGGYGGRYMGDVNYAQTDYPSV